MHTGIFERPRLAKAGLLSLSDFSGGEASAFPLTSTPPKFSALLQNCMYQAGRMKKIPGYSKVNAATCGVELKSGFEFRKIDGTAMILVAGGGKIFKNIGGVLT